MSLVDNDVAMTVLHEFVYHGIKNLGFDESNVHVHVSNGGGHSDIVVIEWEIELNNQYYKALDTKQFFNHLFKRELAQSRDELDEGPRQGRRPQSGGGDEELEGVRVDPSGAHRHQAANEL